MKRFIVKGKMFYNSTKFMLFVEKEIWARSAYDAVLIFGNEMIEAGHQVQDIEVSEI